MAHDQRHVTVTRFDGGASGAWDKAITPADRQWILYVDTDGKPYLYLRAEDVEDVDTGDRLERYVLTARPEGSVAADVAPKDFHHGGRGTPSAPASLKIEVRQNIDATFAFTAYRDANMFANGATARAAVVALLDQIAL